MNISTPEIIKDELKFISNDINELLNENKININLNIFITENQEVLNIFKDSMNIEINSNDESIKKKIQEKIIENINNNNKNNNNYNNNYKIDYLLKFFIKDFNNNLNEKNITNKDNFNYYFEIQKNIDNIICFNESKLHDLDHLVIIVNTNKKHYIKSYKKKQNKTKSKKR